jgi:DNA polymerase (family 10)
VADLTNAQIAAAFEELADLYELDGAVQYRVIAYRNAARTVRDSSVSVIQLAREGRVTDLPGIGKTLEEKLIALDETGDIPSAVKLRERIPVGLISVMQLPGFGPKRARRLYDEIGVDSLDALRAAVEDGRLRGLRGFGLKAEENLRKVLAEQRENGPARRVVLSRALEAAEQVVAALRAHPASDRVEVAGSVRRWADSVKDIDIIATASDPAALARALGELEIVESVGSTGDAGATVTTHSGLKIDLKVVEPDQFGNVLQHFTGSKAHNVALRESAVRRGLHVSEYGILDDATGETLRCATEEEVYAALGLDWIPPELREGRGELEAAAPAGGRLPELIELDDIRGELHCHTTTSDGTETAETMARVAQELGLEYLAITDHSATHGFGDHVTADRLRERIDEIRALNERLDGFELLIGTETNILTDGSPDYPDDLLAELDWVIASVHTSFGMDAKAMTDRIVAAVEHPLVDALGHPTGRKISTRPPYEVDMDRVIEAAARTGTMIEINSSPERRDLNDVHARAAAEAGVRILVNTDAHSIRDITTFRRYGIATARRAWLTREHVANTLPWKELARLRKRASRTA